MTLSWSIQFDWDNDESYAHDEEARVTAVLIERGRSDQFSDFLTGKAVLTLENNDRRFDPWYASSPIYPNVMPRRRVRLLATYGAPTSPLFVGRIEEL